MSGLRRKARELALQALYQSELTQKPATENFLLMAENFDANRKALPYAKALVDGIISQGSALDEAIVSCSANWRLERMSVIDRNILRIAVFEMMHQEDVPASVAMNEAIEIARRFSTDDSSSFINGILDAVSRRLKEDGRDA